MNKMRSRLVLTLGVAAVSISGFAGCGSGESFGCPAMVIPGVIIQVYDAQTGLPTAEGATATVQEGSYTETLRMYPPFVEPVAVTFRGADDRAGTYTIRVTKPGYTAFERSGVRVTAARCGVNTVQLRADLVPIP